MPLHRPYSILGIYFNIILYYGLQVLVLYKKLSVCVCACVCDEG